MNYILKIMKKIILLITLSLLFVIKLESQIQENSIEAAQSLYIYNFTRNIDWGNAISTNDFVISVVGSTSLFNAMRKFMEGKVIVNRPIKVIQVNNINELTKSEIIFLPGNKYKLISEIQTKFIESNTLYVTENSDALNNGSCINFYMLDDRLKFEINKTNIDKQKLRITQTLISSSRSQNN